MEINHVKMLALLAHQSKETKFMVGGDLFFFSFFPLDLKLGLYS